MQNPFEAMRGPKVDNPRGELVEGAFQCEECFENAQEARYLEEVTLLTWKCPSCEHITKIKYKL